MGRLYGVSVGPGDPQLMTLKAANIIEKCGVIAVPRTGGETSIALSIAEQAVDLSGKRKLYFDFPMTADREECGKNYSDIADRLCSELENNDAAFLTLGDISVYSTFSHIGSLVEKRGFETEICAGVTSFSAAAALLGEPLCLGDEELHIIPYDCGDIEKALELGGTKVIMKAGRRAEDLIGLIKAKGLSGCTKIVSNCGLADEKIYRSVGSIDSELGYFTLFIITDRENFHEA